MDEAGGGDVMLMTTTLLSDDELVNLGRKIVFDPAARDMMRTDPATGERRVLTNVEMVAARKYIEWRRTLDASDCE